MQKNRDLNELLNQLNSTQKSKFEYILNFFSDDHVAYNFQEFNSYLENISIFSKSEFKSPLNEKMKRLIDNLSITEVMSAVDNLSFYSAQPVEKGIQDLFLYINMQTDMNESSLAKKVSVSPKYQKMIEEGAISPEEVLECIKNAFDEEIEKQEKIDIKVMQEAINAKLREKLGNRDYSEELKDVSHLPKAELLVSSDVFKRLDDEKVEEAYAFQGNVRTPDSRILAIRAILGENFSVLDYKFAEHLKMMLSKFDVRKMTEDDLQLFIQNLDNIRDKGFDIEDIYYVKNIVNSEEALKAYSNLPENLQEQFLKVNILAKPEETAAILQALSVCKDDETKESPSPKAVLGVPEDVTFGFELEVDGISEKVFRELMAQKELITRLKAVQKIDSDLSRWKIDFDGTVPNGVEFISPVMRDTEKDWKDLNDACKLLESVGAIATEKCGGHIHIGANVLGVSNSAWNNFSKMWSAAEPVIYKLSNPAGEKMRPTGRTEFAPTKPILDDMLASNSIKIESPSDVVAFADAYSRRFLKNATESGRTKGLNLQCIAERKQDTVEFRIPNGSTKALELQETGGMYARMMANSRAMAQNPEYKKATFKQLLVAEKEEDKASNFINLIFDNPEDKAFFYKRYRSQPKELKFGDSSYNDIINNKVEVNKTTEFKWRGYR